MATHTLASAKAHPSRIWLPLRWQILLACTVPVLLMLGNGAIRSFALERSVSSTDWVTHTNQVIGDASALARTIAEAENGERGFLISREAEQLEPYESAVAQFWRVSAALETLITDNPTQVARAREICSLFNRWRLEQAEPAIRSVDAAAGGPLGVRGEPLTTQVRSRLDEFISTERHLLEKRTAVAQGTIAEARTLTMLGTVLSVLMAIFVAVYLAGSIGSSIAELAAAADELTRGSLNRRAMVARRDEVGRLAQSFNTMADALVKRSTEATRTAALGEELQTCLTVEETGAALSRFAAHLAEGAGAMYLLSASRSLLSKSFEWGRLSAETLAPEDCFALRKGHAHYVDDSSIAGVCSHVGAGEPRASACIPLLAHGEILGILHVSTARGDLEILRQTFAGAVAEQLALTIANLQLRDKLYGQAIRDPLTGLFNRRYLKETLARELARSDRSGLPLGVLAIDVDHFKRFNDTFGHEAGDVVLRELGSVLRASFRPSDICARLGGEEFVVVLSNADKTTLLRRAERLGGVVRKLALTHRELSLGTITISIGIAAYPDSSRDAEGLLRAADTALYRAKSEGRDRAVLAEDNNEPLPIVSSFPERRQD